MNFLGLGKTLYNSSICLLKYENKQIAPEIQITERLTRKKYSGAWPLEGLKRLKVDSFEAICENSDVINPHKKEDILNKNFPFFDSLRAQGLEQFTSKYNPKLSFLTHHKAHAYAALFSSPFEDCLIFVADGGGNQVKDFNQEKEKNWEPGSNEHHSLYLFKDKKLTLIDKSFQEHFHANGRPEKKFCNGLGAFYETISEFIFNDNFSSGKVMGLAPFGSGDVISRDGIVPFLESLNWSKSFKGESKEDWENSPHKKDYIQLAATAQATLESYISEELSKHKALSRNLIFTGGVALNCTLNWKIQEAKLFEKIYIPHNPNDLSISLGCAFHELFNNDKYSWKSTPTDEQNPFSGPLDSEPDNHDIPKIFSNYKVTKHQDISETTAQLIDQKEVIAWYQGRSETGPRALGHRSIIANIETPDLKNLLNKEIKFREEFRPYACSVLQQDANLFFKCPEGFLNPFMSYAVPIRSEMKVLLKEVAHIDMTNRMQMVYQNHNQRFYDLLLAIKEKCGYGVLLNTSLNIMGEPIIESPLDLLRFFEKSKIRKAIIGDYLIEK